MGGGVVGRVEFGRISERESVPRFTAIVDEAVKGVSQEAHAAHKFAG